MKVAPGKGWKLASITYTQGDTQKKLKNGGAIKMAKNTVTGVFVNMKKGKQTFSYYLNSDRCY